MTGGFTGGWGKIYLVHQVLLSSCPFWSCVITFTPNCQNKLSVKKRRYKDVPRLHHSFRQSPKVERYKKKTYFENKLNTHTRIRFGVSQTKQQNWTNFHLQSERSWRNFHHDYTATRSSIASFQRDLAAPITGIAQQQGLPSHPFNVTEQRPSLLMHCNKVFYLFFPPLNVTRQFPSLLALIKP